MEGATCYFLMNLKKELPVFHEHGEGTFWYILALILGRCLRGFLLLHQMLNQTISPNILWNAESRVLSSRSRFTRQWRNRKKNSKEYYLVSIVT